MNKLICPVCSEPLCENGGAYLCKKMHSFDTAREGYVNLLLVNRHTSKNPGDSPEMAAARHAFLSGGSYAILARAVAELVSTLPPVHPLILDACCGDGYYTDYITRNVPCEMYAFDISKSMVRLAAKQNKNAGFFVAGINSIPVSSESFDVITHLFAPSVMDEFSRVLRVGGFFLDVTPGKEHLWELKSALYDEPYYNDEKRPTHDGFTLSSESRVKGRISLKSRVEIENLFKMTPYYYKTSVEAAQSLCSLERLDTTVDFVVRLYKRI